MLVANERLYVKLTLGITVTEFMPDGKKHRPTIPLIDWTEPAANLLDVTEEFCVISAQGAHDRSPDIVCFVNGIPLVIVEATRDATSPHGGDGIARHLRNQRDDELPHLFAYAQLLLSIGKTEGRYGTTRTPAKFWARWSGEEEFDDAHVHSLKNERLSPAAHAALFEGRPAALRERLESRAVLQEFPTEADRLLVSLLTPKRLLELLRGFVLFDRKAGKIVARHQQFFAVRALLKRLARVRADGSREGGVIWHTAGSGKSFTMVFLTKALLLDDGLKECRVLAVTDRPDLEQQLARNFMAGGAFGAAIGAQKDGERSKAATGRDLARRIGQGSERITFALLQKFNTASRLPACRNDSRNIVVLVDEGHRSHGGQMHDRMKKVLPNAACVAFTGTPLLKDEKTANRFGPIVHAYTMARAVADNTVVPLLYEERVPELEIDAEAVDRWIDRIPAGLAGSRRAALKNKYAGRDAIYGAASRIELIAWDIALHFSESIRKFAPGLKGQVATASKRDAIRYKRALDDTGLVTSVVVMSPPDLREGSSEVDEKSTPEVQAWWRQNVQAAGLDASSYEKQASRLLHPMAVPICSSWWTGC